MSRTLDQLPSYLRSYCSEHDYSKYTARDQAAWRYIMRRSRSFFQKHAVPSYQDGFAKSGLRIDRIPHIDEIDKALQDYGWGAVPVVGFIAPWAFIEFQARRILPIACDMRTVEHIAYTPAPDIVHEAAGHAPIIPDKAYSDYLAYYASLGTKAIYSQQDLMLYEAVRYLSDIKEKPESTPAIIARAEARLKEAVSAFSFVSEQALVSRMSWWTAEYGLMGSVKAPKIYGAGLLSSVGESKLAMTDAVKKIPLSLDCIQYSYNITEPQPQLFVTESWDHLTDVLHHLDDTLAYKVGGLSSLKKLEDSAAIGTVVLDTGVSITGQLVETLAGPIERLDFLRFNGPVQLCWKGQQLPGHGIERHGHGFSTPLGRLSQRPEWRLNDLNDSQLRDVGLVVGQRCELSFSSGFKVKGEVKQLLKQDGKLILICFKDCTVTQGSRVTFEPAWGEFDMLVGDTVPSVYGGPADRQAYGEHEIKEPETTPARDTPYSDDELASFTLYEQLRKLREDRAPAAQLDKLDNFASRVLTSHPDEWLVLLETYELAREREHNSQTIVKLKGQLENLKKSSSASELLDEGLRLVP